MDFRVLPFGGGYEFIDEFGNREFITDDNAFIAPRNLSFREKAKDFVQNRYGMSKDMSERLFGGIPYGNQADALQRFVGGEGLLGVMPISAGILSGGQAVEDFKQGNIGSGIGNAALAGLDIGLSGLGLRQAYKTARQPDLLSSYINAPSNIPNVKRRPPPVVANETTNKILAYHGSPHTFDKFDISKMGTGEGAQAYGRGLYFSENEEVAKNYRDALSRDIIATVGDTPVYELYNRLIRQADSMKFPSQKGNELYDKAAFLENLEITGSFDEALAVVENPEIAKWAKSEILPKYKPAGNIYQVEIASDVGKFLDYDAPLSEQSDFIKNALENIPKGNVKIIKNADSDRPEFRDRVRPYQVVGTNWKGERVNRPARSLEQAERVKALAEGGNLKLNPNATGADLVSSTPYANQEQMLNVLKGVDIQGIRYLDQGSRGKGYEINVTNKGKPVPMGILDEGDNLTAKTRKDAEEIAKKYRKRGLKADVQPSGTRNLVVFDDKIIDIVKRYGIAGAATLLGMSQLDVQAAMAQENRNNQGLLER
tara:strand:- start:2353 stop:3975 length:1623 start_codon:yes stop_codon:yes gene_type:complete